MARRLSILLLAGTMACSAAPGEAGIDVASGFDLNTIAPDERTEAPPLDGETLIGPLPDTDGAIVVVNFWGSWCGPCRAEQPILEAAWKRYRGRGVRFIGVNTRRDQRAAALAFLEEFDVTYPSIYDPTSAIAADFGVRFMPATFVIDRQGRVAARVFGAVRDRSELAALLDRELAA